MSLEISTPTALTPVSHRVARIIEVLLIIALPILLVIASARLVMTPLFLQLEYNRPGLPVDAYGFTREDRLAYAPYAIGYLLNGEDISYLGKLRLPKENCVSLAAGADDCAMYNVGELRHMRDVKTITSYAFLLAAVLGLFTIAAFYLLWRSPAARPFVRRGLIGGGLLTIGIILTIVILSVTSWDVFFTGFHTLFFETGTWRFAFSDTLIRLFPEQFWFDAAVTVGSLTAGGALVITLLTVLVGKRTS